MEEGKYFSNKVCNLGQDMVVKMSCSSHRKLGSFMLQKTIEIIKSSCKLNTDKLTTKPCS